MTEYRYKVGELVRVQIGTSPQEGGSSLEDIFKSFNGMYRVIRFVPVLVGDEPRYRIKGCYGQAERVVEESFLAPAMRLAEPRY
jgi:hypothetical protein